MFMESPLPPEADSRLNKGFVIKLREANKNVSFTEVLLRFARIVGIQAEACGYLTLFFYE